jgi:hypothetical protein
MSLVVSSAAVGILSMVVVSAVVACCPSLATLWFIEYNTGSEGKRYLCIVLTTLQVVPE